MLKKSYGCAYGELVDSHDYFVAEIIGSREKREVSRAMLSSIIQPRMEEIFSLVAKEMKRSSFGDKMGAGVTLTGGGALMKGVTALGKEVMGMPVKVGFNQSISGLAESVASPEFATGVGLVISGFFPIEQNGNQITRMKSNFSDAGQDLDQEIQGNFQYLDGWLNMFREKIIFQYEGGQYAA